MADPVSYGNHERDIEQAFIALKKGTQLIKYNRKGKPKFCSFRLSTGEFFFVNLLPICYRCFFTCYSDETALIWYSRGGERTLKLSSVCRITPGQRTAVFKRYLRPEKDYLSFSLIYNNGERSLDLICKDKAEAEVWLAGLKSLISSGHRSRRTRSDISDLHDGDSVQNGRPFGAALEFTSSIVHDGFRVSISSTPSCSSGGSGPDDIESLGDVYVWGAIWMDGVVGDGSGNPVPTKTDVLIPKPLESNVVLDVHQVASAVGHIALVTRQGEVFTWGEESGGRLGHGIDKDVSHPHLVEFLASTNVDFVACGEHHTCAVSTSGDLFTWGDGTHNAGLLGHGTNVSHWIPKRVSCTLEGLQVLSVACGTWHSALATSNGKLFTFGDGAFGVLGHGDQRECIISKGAIVEVTGYPGANASSRRLFTWGDGEKYRLGHRNKETHLQPTCVSSLTEYKFQQLACAHTMTVVLTTSGHVFTMGGTAHGQLGNPSADGKLPCLVQDKLVGEFVEEISCGAHHVAVLTSRSEVYTWGKGANGRLGHGDIKDRKSPTLVEALKDRHVKNISCGSNFTTSICVHKWVSGADQSACSGCRQAFGFTRKRHNCYNCGLVHCHACSSKKALKAALAPTPGKPHRVCDSCYAKLKAAEAGIVSNMNRKATAPRRSVDGSNRIDRGEIKSSRILLSPTTEPVKYLEMKSGKPGTRPESPSIVRASQVPSLLQLKDIAFPSSLSALQNVFKPIIPPVIPSTPQPAPSPPNSRPASPYSRRPSPPRSATPPFSRSLIDSLRKTNELLNQEVLKLQNQMRSLKQKSDCQDMEIQKLQKNFKEATSLAGDKSSKCRVAKELMKFITEQLNEMTSKLPPEVSESATFRDIHAQAETFLKENPESEICTSLLTSLESDQQNEPDRTPLVIEASKLQEQRTEDHVDAAGGLSQNGGNVNHHRNSSSVSNIGEAVPPQSSENGSGSPDRSTIGINREKQVIEHFEPGVYVTLVVLPNGSKVFKRVRFSKRRFDEHQAEEWWNKNKDRVFRRYSPSATNPSPSGQSSTTKPHTEESIETAHSS
ncbi:Regulator of chromosome condensation (RCC1) family with FYVE zinc finger domain [Quillaja saponaria]|uniref:Regulator of chromosome condensation (RCC1) family with FYVE zinc finger domain n=1 Tax=Quillaja saponaria TaxID=32244 RepID=A0AAD7QE53_QUISA|nr:Regulator of chromosome condensation (RCC1) family with FYVE zinc finger domain [Quillaja saponaria]